MNQRASENMIAGFRKSGLYPIDVEQPLKRLPQNKPVHDDENTANSIVANGVITMLAEMRGNTQNGETRGRRKRINVAAGQSVLATDLNSNRLETVESVDDRESVLVPEVAIASGSGLNNAVILAKKRGRPPHRSNLQVPNTTQNVKSVPIARKIDSVSMGDWVLVKFDAQGSSH